MKRLVVVGSTGSIGRQTMEVAAAHPDKVQVVGAAAGRNVELLADQARQFGLKRVVIADEELVGDLKTALQGTKTKVAAGPQALVELVSMDEADCVVMAVVGAVGIEPTLAAIRAGKQIALANKETLVAAGELVVRELASSSASLVPLDSEHSAIFQCLSAANERHVAKLWLTASGGPFLHKTIDELQEITPKEALRHPNWSMGAKITVDSATLMNKGLEVIEAHWLFGVPYERIRVVVHPQSIIHSLIELVDGSIIAQMGPTDMRLPIQFALSYPERWPAVGKQLDLRQIGRLELLPPDPQRFPCLSLAYDAGKRGGTAPAVLNAANEVAVEAFLTGRLPFLAIAEVVGRVLNEHAPRSMSRLATVLEADSWARRKAQKIVARLQKTGV